MTCVINYGYICVASLVSEIAQRTPHVCHLKVQAGFDHIKTRVLQCRIDNCSVIDRVQK